MEYVLLALGIAVSAAGFFLRRGAVAKHVAEPTKKNKRLRTAATLVVVFGLYLALTQAITRIFGPHEKGDLGSFSPWAERTELFGLDISMTVVWTWVIMAGIVLLALILRFTALRKLTDSPGRAQNAAEAAVEMIVQYTGSNVHGEGEMLGSYVFAVAALLVGCAVLELFGIRTPASDVTFTLGLSLITFILINYYGIRKKGIGGRIRSLANPTPVVLPIKIVTDLAIPVSLAARLFGNMLGGMIIMDLLYSALGNSAVGIPSVAGLYFNVFHPLLQAFIFITLTLTFIREAVE